MVPLTPTPLLSEEDRNRLYSLMDMLTAVQIDLGTLCVRPLDDTVGAASTIEQACGILRSASEDLGHVIRRLEGPVGLKHIDGASRAYGDQAT